MDAIGKVQHEAVNCHIATHCMHGPSQQAACSCCMHNASSCPASPLKAFNKSSARLAMCAAAPVQDIHICSLRLLWDQQPPSQRGSMAYQVLCLCFLLPRVRCCLQPPSYALADDDIGKVSDHCLVKLASQKLFLHASCRNDGVNSAVGKPAAIETAVPGLHA